MSTVSGGVPPAEEPRPDAKPERESLSPPVAFGAYSGTAAAIIAGIVILVRGSGFGTVFLVLGLVYVYWLLAVRAGNDEGKAAACGLICVFCVVWAIVSAAADHDYAYGLGVGAYGVWAFAAACFIVAATSRRSLTLLLVSHLFAALGLVLVGLAWQADTALALTAIVLALSTLASIGVDRARARGQGAGPAIVAPPS